MYLISLFLFTLPTRMPYYYTSHVLHFTCDILYLLPLLCCVYLPYSYILTLLSLIIMTGLCEARGECGGAEGLHTKPRSLETSHVRLIDNIVPLDTLHIICELLCNNTCSCI